MQHLAGLWPWLLMAASQVALGHTGLELAAAVESERSAPRAMIKVSLLKQEPTSKPIILEGVFAGGSAGVAEGKLMQVRAGRCFQVSFIGLMFFVGIFVEFSIPQKVLCSEKKIIKIFFMLGKKVQETVH